MRQSRILTKMLLTITLVVITTSVFAVSVFAYYELLISNNDNVIQAGTYSTNIEVYVTDSASGTDSIEGVKVTKIASINDVINYIFNVIDDKEYYISVSVKNDSSSIKNLQVGIDSSSGIEIKDNEVVFFKLTKADSPYKYWTKPINSSIKYEPTESTLSINLGNPPLTSMMMLSTTPEVQEENETNQVENNITEENEQAVVEEVDNTKEENKQEEIVQQEEQTSENSVEESTSSVITEENTKNKETTEN